MNKKNKYITVLDFEHGSVFRYEVGICDYQEYLSNKGHNLSNCEWMIHKNPEIYTQTKEGDIVITN